MKTEQEINKEIKKYKEAIKLAKEFTKMDFSNPMGWTGYYDTELKELQECIKIVLNMLKEKDKEIEKLKKENEHWKNGFERELEDNRENSCELLKQDLIIRKQEKQIDLMVEFIAILDIEEDICVKTGKDLNKCDCMTLGKCENCIKQYFKSKVEKE